MLQTLAKLLDSPFFHKVCSALIIVVVGILAIRVLMHILQTALERSKLEKAAHSLITSLTKSALYILLGLITASALGLDVSSIVALASVLTLALSLALQNMVSNVIGGFTILYTKPFHSGDFVEIAGQSGTVQEINMSYTILCTADNKQISLPNSAVVAAQVVNYTALGSRRMTIDVTAGYDAPTRKVIAALLRAGDLEQVLDDPAPSAVITNYGDSAIAYSLRLWTHSEDYWDVYFTVMQRVKDVFDEDDIPMTYPHLNVHLDK